MRKRLQYLSVFAMFALTALVLPQQGLAATAAGTSLDNTVTVNYKDASNVAQTAVTSSVSVTVNLVGGVSWGTVSANQATDSGVALPGAYSVTLSNTGNGSDTFTLTDGTTQPGTLAAGTWTILPADEDGVTAGHQITLFGTISSSATWTVAAGTTTIPVGNLTVADLVAGTTKVSIGGTLYTVAAGSTATQLVVTGDASAAAAAGVAIGEQVTVTYNGTAGLLTAGTVSADYTHNLTATGLDTTATGGNASATATTANFVTTVNGASLLVTKYVRNITNANGNVAGATPIVINGNTYYRTGVTGDPTNVLEYAVVINNAAAGQAKSVVLTDTVSAFTTLSVDATLKFASAVPDITSPIVGATFDKAIGTAGETGAAADGAIVANAATGDLTVYVGTGGSDTTLIGGAIAGSATGIIGSIVLYQVTIQ